jgi:phenylalanyl-tRNA synthetase alpha chain
MNLKKQIEQIKKEFSESLDKVNNEQSLDDLRIKFLSRQGEVALLMSRLKELNAQEKREIGPLLNAVKREFEELYNSKREIFTDKKIQAAQDKLKHFDVTAYKPNQLQGHLHPITIILQKLENVFLSMGYEIVDGPELEDDYYNFQALNIPADHPARDMQDTFWLNLPNKLMRTQTSPVQIRVMENKKPPVAILSVGRAYRNESTDSSHDFVFEQAEGLMVSQDISLANLLATLRLCLQEIFEKKDLEIRVRPGYFPFVEPGLEVDMLCPFCKEGCSVCKKTRWIEIAGAGLVHPNVLKACGVDSKKYSGFAFGMGLTRIVMLKFGINDIRLLSSNKIDFLNQF